MFMSSMTFSGIVGLIGMSGGASSGNGSLWGSVGGVFMAVWAKGIKGGGPLEKICVCSLSGSIVLALYIVAAECWIGIS